MRTHQGTLEEDDRPHTHLDEAALRFNRHKTIHRSNLFLHLLEPCIATHSILLHELVANPKPKNREAAVLSAVQSSQ